MKHGIAAALTLGAVAFASSADGKGFLDFGGREALEIEHATIGLDVKEAERLIADADLGETDIALQRGFLDLYEGKCDDAALILGRDDVAATEAGADLGDIARGCERTMAGTFVVEDKENGILFRLQDDADRALLPWLTEVAVKTRKALSKELGVELPQPLRIDLLRDQFALSAMTGLPEQAARTTGTIAVAKFGRVMMISPRATRHGYPWLDTLAHEMTHLALSRGSHDRAPLWLQEGVAKYFETRWREKSPFDDVPPSDYVAKHGLENDIGADIGKIGPSIAMLDSAEAAGVTFAKVTSFIRYMVESSGDAGFLGKLVDRIDSIEGPADESVDRALVEISGRGFTAWRDEWREHIKGLPAYTGDPLLPSMGDGPPERVIEQVRLGQLLMKRGHYEQAAQYFRPAHEAQPRVALLRSLLAEALEGAGKEEEAAEVVASLDDIRVGEAQWWSLHGHLHPKAIAEDLAYRRGIESDPYDPPVACDRIGEPGTPKDPARAALCKAAREMPRAL